MRKAVSTLRYLLWSTAKRVRTVSKGNIASVDVTPACMHAINPFNTYNKLVASGPPVAGSYRKCKDRAIQHAKVHNLSTASTEESHSRCCHDETHRQERLLAQQRSLSLEDCRPCPLVSTWKGPSYTCRRRRAQWPLRAWSAVCLHHLSAIT